MLTSAKLHKVRKIFGTEYGEKVLFVQRDGTLNRIRTLSQHKSCQAITGTSQLGGQLPTHFFCLASDEKRHSIIHFSLPVGMIFGLAHPLLKDFRRACIVFVEFPLQTLARHKLNQNLIFAEFLLQTLARHKSSQIIILTKFLAFITEFSGLWTFHEELNCQCVEKLCKNERISDKTLG